MQARAENLAGDANAAISSLEAALALSDALGDKSGDVDTLGHLADIYVDQNDFEKASELYDQVIAAIQVEELSSPMSSTWDC